jgi:tetratricopeptide (TPR) repeat protein
MEVSMVASDPKNVLEEKQPSTAEEFVNLGWAKKASGNLDDAEANFRKAISQKPDLVEAHYGLGLVLKAQDRRQDCIQSCEKVIELIDRGIDDRVRGEMLRRLSLAHINQLRSGDWGLEQEIWKHK